MFDWDEGQQAIFSADSENDWFVRGNETNRTCESGTCKTWICGSRLNNTGYKDDVELKTD